MHYNHEMGRECPEYRTMKYLFFFFPFVIGYRSLHISDDSEIQIYLEL